MNTHLDEIAARIYRVSVYIPEADFMFNQFLVDGDEPLLFHTGPRQLFPIVSRAINQVRPVEELRWINVRSPGIRRVRGDEPVPGRGSARADRAWAARLRSQYRRSRRPPGAAPRQRGRYRHRRAHRLRYLVPASPLVRQAFAGFGAGSVDLSARLCWPSLALTTEGLVGSARHVPAACWRRSLPRLDSGMPWGRLRPSDDSTARTSVARCTGLRAMAAWSRPVAWHGYAQPATRDRDVWGVVAWRRCS